MNYRLRTVSQTDLPKRGYKSYTGYNPLPVRVCGVTGGVTAPVTFILLVTFLKPMFWVMSAQVSLIVGFDPGFTGAIGFYDLQTRTLADVMDMPTFDPKAWTHWRSTGKSDRIQFDISKLAKTIRDLQPRIRLSVVEKVGPHPNMGVSGCFRFGHGAGLIEGILAALEIPIQLVHPAVWKGQLGLSSNKSESRKMAARQFPEFKDYFSHKQDDGRAEACLLAEYGLRFVHPTPAEVERDIKALDGKAARNTSEAEPMPEFNIEDYL
jgi:hypothetical protein